MESEKELMDKIIKINFDDVESLNSGNFSITLKKKK